MLRAAALLLLVLSAAAGAAAAAQVEPPRFTVGDFWEYEVREKDDEVVAKLTTRVASIEQERSPVGPIEVVRLESETTLTSGGASGTTTAWLRASDLAILRSRTVQTSGNHSVAQTIQYQEPCRGYQWPLEVGASWNTTCRMTRTTEIPGEAPRTQRDVDASHTRVLREANATLPAGAFATLSLLVTRGAGDESLQQFAPRACQPVHIVSGERVTQLVRYRCAATESDGGARDETPGALAFATALGLTSAALVARKRT